MPINFLKKIKLTAASKSTTELSVVFRQLRTEHVSGVYVFPCKELKSNQPLFNDGLPSLIFMPRKSDVVHLEENGELKKFNAAWVCCGEIQNTYWEVPQGLDYIVVLRFNPSSFYSLFNVEPSVFHTRPICNLSDILDESWMRIFDMIYDKQTLSEKISYLDQVLSSLQSNDFFPDILTVAIDYIEGKRGNTTVSEVLQQLGKQVNPKWLHRNFVKYIGISPKKYISLQRFIYTYGQYDKRRSDDLFGTAILSGYYDYYHFFKDFKKYIGIAPSQYTWE
ncbi:MAG: helix-turn-helix domain-containing protein [Sphingobacteriaceae bacterium]